MLCQQSHRGPRGTLRALQPRRILHALGTTGVHGGILPGKFQNRTVLFRRYNYEKYDEIHGMAQTLKNMQCELRMFIKEIFSIHNCRKKKLIKIN